MDLICAVSMEARGPKNDALGTGVTDIWDPPDMGAENQLGPRPRTVSALNCNDH